jgi:group I intron endonuclease
MSYICGMSKLINYLYDQSLLDNLTKLGIYKISHVDKANLFYIGSASSTYVKKGIQRGFYIRFWHHINDLKLNKHNSRYLQNVVNKYGIEGIRFEIVEIVDSTDRKIILEREQYYLDALKPAYNSSTIARCPTVPYTDERKKAVSTRMKGRKLPDSVYDIRRIPVFQFTIKGKLIKKYDSATQAFKELGIDRGSINNAALGKRKSAGGYLWSFNNSVTVTQNEVIQQFDFAGNLINTYTTLEEVLKMLNITSRTALKNAYNGNQYQAYGYQWRKGYYVDKIDKLPEKKIPGKPIYQIDFVTNKIIKEFPNTTYAAKALNISKTSINNCAIGKYKQGGGYRWKYK